MGSLSKPLFVVENGLGAVDTPDENGYVEDDYRIDYLRQHVLAMRDAIVEDGVELMGYTTWGCIDLVSAGTGEMKNATASSTLTVTMREMAHSNALRKII